MKKLVVALLLCCAVVAFATSCASSRFSAVMNEISLDTSSEGVLGYFDIVVKIPRHPSGQSLGAHDPAVIAAIQGEITRLGGTRAIDVRVDGEETFGNTTVRVIGTVVR
ncbi:MAG: hypothetical protein LBK00_01100 [Treponema sp.]|nr:hypothetical protein [Treponema sp.]